MSNYIKLGDLEIYTLAIDIGRLSGRVFTRLDWHNQKIIGDQFIRSIDSIAANIAEGHGRFHYKDKAKFYYYSRGSLFESKHWILLLYERKYVDKENC